jgi:2-(1,2-epoxy-1,2-dihydrophenyl)acetyl-CoA isomerase
MHNTKVLVSVADGIRTIQFNRPEKRNAVDAETLSLLREAVDEAARDASRVVIITGAGDSFCAGADLTARTPDKLGGYDVTRALREYANRVVLTIRSMPKPVIARVHGPAAGMGCSLALACDLRIASEQARFSQAFIRIGLMPDGGSTYLLPRMVGYGKAFELMATGDPIEAREALALGIVNRVVRHDELDTTVGALASRLAAAPALALAKIKKALSLSEQSSLAEMLDFEAVNQAECFASADFREGVAAFLEKRTPRYGPSAADITGK